MSVHTLAAPLRYLYRHRVLTLEMARREITDRYAGQMLGALWAVGHPLILVAVYVFVFGHIFAMKIGGTVEMPLDYTAYLLAGLLPWMAFQESMAKGTGVMVANAGLVKQVVFPIEVLPVKGVLASLVSQFIGTLCLAVYVFWTSGGLPWTWVLLPVLLAAQSLAMAGVSLILASVGAYFRDIKDIVQVWCVAGIYLMPVVYLPTWVPDVARPVLYVNPFSYMTWCYQDACYYGRFEHPWAWAVFLPGSAIIFLLGFKLFARLKVHFGSVL